MSIRVKIKIIVEDFDDDDENNNSTERLEKKVNRFLTCISPQYVRSVTYIGETEEESKRKYIEPEPLTKGEPEDD